MSAKKERLGMSIDDRAFHWPQLLGGALAVLLLVSLQGCDSLGGSFLEEPPGQDVTKDTVFSDANSARQFLWNAYRTLPYGPGEVSDTEYNKRQVQGDMLASLTDINHSFLPSGGAGKRYYSPTGIPYSNHQTKYDYANSGAWAGIRQAHIFLDNVDQVPDMEADTKQRLKGEARMIIALHYTDMYRHFGGLPWVDQAYGPNDDFDAGRLTSMATLDSIVAVIDEAADDLPLSVNNPASESGRFTRAGALGLKCKVLLFGASPLFNDSQPYMQGTAADQEMVWHGGYVPALWQRAADACGTLIDEVEGSSQYHLVDTGNPEDDFRNGYYQRESPEVLISTRVRYRSPGGVGGCDFGCSYYYGSIINGGAGATTRNYVQMFPMADGTPIDESGSGYDPQNPYENRDPRLYETVLVNGDEYRERTAELWIGGRERQSQGTRATSSGYRMRKFVLDGESAFGTVVHFPWLRLSEIYLAYAEALNEANGGPTSEAYTYVNRVRNRVDLGDLPSDLSQQEFREAVLRERALELGYEHQRWFDLIRWKREDDLTKPLYGTNICKQGETPASVCGEDSYGSREFIYDKVRLPQRTWQTNWSPQWYLSAFPVEEVSKVDGMVQNPGWE